MCESACGARKVVLGFAHGDFPVGTHICQIVGDDFERDGALLNYIVAGLVEGEQTACFSGRLDKEALARRLSEKSISIDASCQKGDLTLAGTREVYFEGECFDPDRMLGMLEAFYFRGKEYGYPASRVIGEMIPEIHSIKGGSRLLEYESRVSLFLENHPVTAVCQYDAREFDGATIMDVLKVHPYMVVRGAVVSNPFFVKPEEILNLPGKN